MLAPLGNSLAAPGLRQQIWLANSNCHTCFQRPGEVETFDVGLRPGSRQLCHGNAPYQKYGELKHFASKSFFSCLRGYGTFVPSVPVTDTAAGVARAVAPAAGMSPEASVW